MKILHIGNLKSGIDTYVRNVIATASDEFEFVVINGADDNNAPYIRNGKQVKNYHIDMYRALNPFNDFKAIAQATKIVLREKPDTIHCHSAKGGAIGRIVGLITNVSTLYTPHAFSFLSTNSKIKRQIYIIIERLLKLNSILLACSESERELGIKLALFSKEKSFAWNNAIPKIEDTDIHISADINPKEKFIISIGRPSFQKNPLLMVEIMKKVHKRQPDVKFYLIGVGFYAPLLDEMEKLIADYKLTEVIKLLPWLSHNDTLGYLKQSLLYFTTSLYEGLPIAVLEAMAMKKAIISSDVIGNRDCVKNGYNGYLLPMEANTFANKICELIDNDNMRNEMSTNSYSYFLSDFEISSRIKALEKIYLSINN